MRLAPQNPKRIPIVCPVRVVRFSIEPILPRLLFGGPTTLQFHQPRVVEQVCLRLSTAIGEAKKRRPGRVTRSCRGRPAATTAKITGRDAPSNSQARRPRYFVTGPGVAPILPGGSTARFAAPGSVRGAASASVPPPAPSPTHGVGPASLPDTASGSSPGPVSGSGPGAVSARFSKHPGQLPAGASAGSGMPHRGHFSFPCMGLIQVRCHLIQT